MTRTANKNLTLVKADMPRRKSGRAVIEQDGRSIWEWQTATGVFERDVTIEQIAKLEDADLSLVEEDESGRTIYASAANASDRRQSSPAPTDNGSIMTRLLKRIGVRN